jgi:hypothetical protein
MGLIGLFFLTQVTIMARETVAIINFDVIGSNYEEAQYISMVTSEIRKQDTLDVVDKYTVSELVQERVLGDKKMFWCKVHIGFRKGTWSGLCINWFCRINRRKVICKLKID